MVFCVCLHQPRNNLSTESLILPNYAPESILPPSLPSSLRSPCLLHSFGPSSSMGKLLSRQFLRGRHSTNPLHHPGWGGSWIFLPEFYFWVPQVLRGWESSCRLFHKVTPVVFLCVCPAGDHPSRKGWIWLHHLLGFPGEGAGCRSRQVSHEYDEEFPHQCS